LNSTTSYLFCLCCFLEETTSCWVAVFLVKWTGELLMPCVGMIRASDQGSWQEWDTLSVRVSAGTVKAEWSLCRYSFFLTVSFHRSFTFLQWNFILLRVKFGMWEILPRFKAEMPIAILGRLLWVNGIKPVSLSVHISARPQNNGELWYSETMSNFSGQIVDFRPRSASRDLQTKGVPPLANEFCLLRGVTQQSRIGLIYFILYALWTFGFTLSFEW